MGGEFCHEAIKLSDLLSAGKETLKTSAGSLLLGASRKDERRAQGAREVASGGWILADPNHSDPARS
jgi:hypothetical protein